MNCIRNETGKVVNFETVSMKNKEHKEKDV
jgi:hypothetical protein